jgi:uncharacterized membrane protein YeiH
VICSLPKEKKGNGRILHSVSDLYATTALTGASIYILAFRAGLNVHARVGAGVLSAMLLRVMASEYDLGLPAWDKMNLKTEASCVE